MQQTILIEYLRTLLRTDGYEDYCPNGLQVQGSENIQHIVGGVTASQALIQTAIEKEADTLLVHHGFFWKGEHPCVVGPKAQRLKMLLQHNINLLAYHLPLDTHPTLGNNAQIAKALEINDLNPDDENLLRFGTVSPILIEDFIARVSNTLHRPPLHLNGGPDTLKTIAWCTGGAQNMIEAAAAGGADLFLSGEVSESTTHSASELGIHYLACGHHATETFGVKALGEHLAQHFELSFQFVDLPNPV